MGLLYLAARHFRNLRDIWRKHSLHKKKVGHCHATVTTSITVITELQLTAPFPSHQY